MRNTNIHRQILFALLTAMIFVTGFSANSQADSCALFNELFSGTSGNTWNCGSHGKCTINNGRLELTNPESGYYSYATTSFMPTGFFTIDADVTETSQFPGLNSPGIGIYPFTTGDLLFSISNVATDGFAVMYYPESSQMNFMFWDVSAAKWNVTQYQAVTGPVTSIGMKVLNDKVVFRANRKDTGISLPGVFTMPQVIDSLWMMASGSFSMVSFDNICASLNSDPTPLQTVLSVSPTNQDVTTDAGTTTFSVSNTGTGTMPWTALVTSGVTWLSITSGASGTNSGTINCDFTTNTSSSARTATIRVTAIGATGSPVDVTVTQAPTSVQTVLSVSPTNQDVTTDAGTTTFSVSNTGTGTMPWTALVTSGVTWLSITSGASGTNSGTINCDFTTNTSSSARTATIRVTAIGATDSPQEVTVTQAPTSTPKTTRCTATLDENLLLHIPYLTYDDPASGTLSLWVDLVYESNPKQIIFKYKRSGVINRPSFSCPASTLSADLNVHIPDVLLPDGVTHLWVDLEYSTAPSIMGNIYFIVTNYGVISD